MNSYRAALGADLATRNPPDRAVLPTQSLRRRLLVLVAGSIFPVLILTTAIVMQGYTRAEQAAEERVLQITRSTIAAVDRELQNRIAALEILALSPALQTGDIGAFRNDVQRFLSRDEDGAGISLSDASGQQLLNSNAAPGEVLPPRTDIEATRSAFATQKPYVSNMYLGHFSKRPIFSIDVPVMRDNQVVYNLTFISPRAPFTNILQQLNLPRGWIISIFDRNAHHVARLPSLNEAEISSASSTLRPHLGTGSNRVVETISLEGVTILTAFTRSEETGWVVALGIPVETVSGPARQTLFTTFSIGLLLLLVGLAFASRLATHLMRAEAHRDLLVNELNHRVKNTLSAVQAIVGRGLLGSSIATEQRNAIEARLLALSHVHNILSSHSWEGADLRAIAAAIIEPYTIGNSRRLVASGPSLTLKPRVAISMALVLNELVTNAAKYGALSTSDGIIELTWGTAGDKVRITWKESGGPPVNPPAQTGYGTRFIERAVLSELDGAYVPSYSPEGLRVVLEFKA
jgi:two-component sensor histidine kinase